MSSYDFAAITNVIHHRRSVFPPSYIQKEIPKALLTELLRCADAAPTHKLTQPWRFVVFRGAGLHGLANHLAELYRLHTPPAQFLQKKYDSTREKVLRSGAVITISIAYSGALPQWEELAATACAVENLWLAASAAGIGGYWSTPATAKLLDGFLQLNPNEECVGLFYMGYHDEPAHAARRTPIEDKIRWVE